MWLCQACRWLKCARLSVSILGLDAGELGLYIIAELGLAMVGLAVVSCSADQRRAPRRPARPALPQLTYLDCGRTRLPGTPAGPAAQSAACTQQLPPPGPATPLFSPPACLSNNLLETIAKNSTTPELHGFGFTTSSNLPCLHTGNAPNCREWRECSLTPQNSFKSSV